jgi:hypothetical protein
MDIKQLKKLINEEVAKIKMQEATNPGTPKAKIKAAASLASVDPNAPTVKKSTPRDPSVAPPLSKQPISKSSYQNAEDVYYGLRRMKIELLTKFEIEFKDEEASQIIRDIFDQEVNKLTAKHPELDVE